MTTHHERSCWSSDLTPIRSSPATGKRPLLLLATPVSQTPSSCLFPYPSPSLSIAVVSSELGRLAVWFLENLMNLTLNIILFNWCLTLFVTVAGFITCWVLWPARATALAQAVWRLALGVACIACSAVLIAHLLLGNAKDLVGMSPTLKKVVETAAVTQFVPPEQAAALTWATAASGFFSSVPLLEIAQLILTRGRRPAAIAATPATS